MNLVGSQWNALEREEDARQHLLLPAEDMSKLGTASRPLLAYGEGIHVVDTHGRRLIDGPAGMWCTQIGYQRREIADALSAQALRLSYNSPWYTVNSPAAELAARIAGMTPGDLNRVFFTTGGSTAVDTALRFSEFYNNVLGRTDKKRIIVRKDGYHGSTSLTAACSGREGNWPNFDIRQDRIAFISSPNMRHAEGRTEAVFLDVLVAEFEARLNELGPSTVAAFLAEPLLASGGVIIPPAGYHARIKAICESHDILYISDEVVTAFGRCGEWFASEKVFGVTPDIITFAKGVTSGYVPLGGLAISERVLARVSGENAKGSFFSNGYTYTGHPVSCAAALANIDVIENDGLLQHVRDISGYFAAALRSLEGLPLVADTRASGLVGCVECMADTSRSIATDLDRKIGARIDAICFDLGLIVRPIGNMCVLSPPLIIEREQIDEMCGILRQGILQAAAEFERGEIS
ncbi:aminotransferase [Mesorhizobium sp. YC-39]|uniref:aminotransferase n=1 Tax=unclassified Mesorhizobium TaxID=325217 RepID=UPI0021E8666C|nr:MULTISPECIES: aminotransferase [unclassified Mesorhizobium]MCV3210821.1 aminotransferase [Mesorhizobium sp. YC-2]MCV3231055.1 aminotransferase [Mesorhizobium sp. YC-39]